MMNSLIKYGLFVLLAASIFMYPSCSDIEPSLSRSSKVLADSLFRVEEAKLRIEMDSICDNVYQGIFDKAVDSISAQRLKEIEKILSTK